MGEHQNRAVSLEGEGNDSIGASPEIFDPLSTVNRMSPDRPFRDLFTNLCCRSSLVFAVVPFEKVVLGDTSVTEPGAGHGFPGPGQGAGEDEIELITRQHLAEGVGLTSSQIGQGDVGAPGVFPRHAPLGLPVTHQGQFGRGPQESPFVIHSQSSPSSESAFGGPQVSLS